jgi:cytochrome c biogenesis protein CcmG/thiol:disulfide interchange protein DsbE
MIRAFYAVPLFIFLILCIVMVDLLFNTNKLNFIERPLPPLDYALPTEDPVIVNFFASWCVPCRAEHAQIAELSQKYNLKAYGIAYKDKPEDVEKYLNDLGDPYEHIIYDSGNIFIDWGLSGVPESFVVYKDRIRYRHQGPIMPDDVTGKIAPMLRELR